MNGLPGALPRSDAAPMRVVASVEPGWRVSWTRVPDRSSSSPAVLPAIVICVLGGDGERPPVNAVPCR
jgi:hypothetical protein